MRETATLTRPVPRSGTWQEEPTSRLPVRRPAILLGVLFIVGLGLGWTITRFVARPPAQQISNVEYTAVVAQLFQRDHNLAIAQERLALYGVPNGLVQQAIQAGQSGQLRSPTDLAAIDALAQALNVPPGSQANSQAAVGTTGEDVPSTSQSNAGQPAWLGPLLAFVMAFALGAIVLMRTAGLSLALNRLSIVGRLPFKLPSREGRRDARALVAERDRDDRAPKVALAQRGELSDEPSPSARAASAPVTPRPANRAALVGASRGNTAVARARRAPIFQSSYRLGDDPFDEIHPITDPATGSLIAACGLSAALKLDSLHTSRYFAFTAWLQDYVDHEELHAAGLVAPGALERSRAQIEGWVRGGQIDTVRPLERGMSIPIGTNDLVATITVVNVEYGHEAAQPDSYVSQLTVRFEVQHAEAADRSN